MAVKSIIDIEINDDKFKKFVEDFNKHKKEVDKLPDVWDDVSKKTEKTAVSFEQMAALMLAQADYAKAINEHVTDITEKHEAVEPLIAKQARHWQDMARSAGAFAVKIGDATRWLLRWASLTGVVSGLLGGGGLFGIERMGLAVGGARRSSLGLGVSPGEQSAFNTKFGRVISSPQFLSGVNEALHDVTKRVALYGAGMTGDLSGKSTSDVAADLIPMLKRIADETPDAMMAQVLRARHLDQFISLEDFQRLKRTSASELEGYGRSYRGDIKTMDYTSAEQKAWQDLQVQLHRAAVQIETVFVKGLTPLAPAITKLSEAFTRLVSTLMKETTEGGWIEKFAKGIDWLSDKIQTPEFQSAVVSFTRDVVLLAKAVGAGIAWLAAKAGWLFNNVDLSRGNPQGLTGMAESGGFFNGRFGLGQAVVDPVTGATTLPYGLGGTEWGLTPQGLGDPDAFRVPSYPPRAVVPPGGTWGIPRGTRNNNPTNLTYYPGQVGIVGQDDAFGIYGSMDEGIRAAWTQPGTAITIPKASRIGLPLQPDIGVTNRWTSTIQLLLSGSSLR